MPSLFRHRGLTIGLILICLTGSLTGCRALALFGREEMRAVKAEYPYLDDKRVLALIWAETDTLYDYPLVQLDLGDFVCHGLTSYIDGVTCVPPQTVADMQRRELNWDEVHPAVLAKRFDADRAILIELSQYATREPDSPHLYRGRIVANVRVYDPAYGTDVGPVYQTDISVTYPEGGPGAYGTNDREVRRAAMSEFAMELARKFYDHKVKAE